MTWAAQSVHAQVRPVCCIFPSRTGSAARASEEGDRPVCEELIVNSRAATFQPGRLWAKAPESVIATIRDQASDYQAQLDKSRQPSRRLARIFDIQQPEVVDAVSRALEEDIGSGDVTTDACVPEELEAEGYFSARQSMTAGGRRTAATDVLTTRRCRCSDHCRTTAARMGDVLASVRGPGSDAANSRTRSAEFPAAS